MSYNGSGTYTLPGPQLASGETVSATENNQFRNDVAGALNVVFCRDGQSLPTANLPMDEFKFTGLGAGTAAGDSVRYEQVTSNVAITGGTINGVAITSGTINGAAITGGTIDNTVIGATTATSAKVTNLEYTGTLTGGTEIVNIGSGQVYKDVNGNVGIGTSVPTGKLTVVGNFNVKSGSFLEYKSTIPASNINLSTGNYFSKTISEITTFTVSNTPANNDAISFILDITNGGSSAVIWWPNVKWPEGVAPILTSSGRDVLGFYTYDNGSIWNGFVIGKDVK